MNLNRLSKLSNLVTNDLKRKPTIIIDPNPEQPHRMFGTANDVTLDIDTDDWIVPNNLRPFIQELTQNNNDSIEEKILEIYKKICESYIYDDDVLSYVRKNPNGTFSLPDSRGRTPDPDMKEDRNKHNRRNCFEISRILAESITSLLRTSKLSDKYDVCILWDEAVTHYFVGLVSNDYCVTLDIDDFRQIKDLTRMKTGLTLEGIKVLDDPYNKFRPMIEKLNEGKSKIAINHITEKRKEFIKGLNVDTNNNSQSADYGLSSSDDVEFLKITIKILKESYNLDSAGIYEYLKEIVDMKFGTNSRKKVWKEIEIESDSDTSKTRNTLGLLVTLDDVTYFYDPTQENPEEMFRVFNQEEMEGPNAKVKPFGYIRTLDDDDGKYDEI